VRLKKSLHGIGHLALRQPLASVFLSHSSFVLVLLQSYEKRVKSQRNACFSLLFRVQNNFGAAKVTNFFPNLCTFSQENILEEKTSLPCWLHQSPLLVPLIASIHSANRLDSFRQSSRYFIY
jgi:hypothetical protein